MDTGKSISTDVAGEASTSVEVSLHDQWDQHWLQQEWLKLESKSCSNAFLSWTWIKEWLTLCKEKPVCVVATINNTIVGMGLLCVQKHSALPGRPIKTLWLHRTGQTDRDQVWVEHNDFLLDRDYQEDVRKQLIAYLLSENVGFDELKVGMATTPMIDSVLVPEVQLRTDFTVLSYALDLSSYQSLQDYLASLSKNTRSQITRTKKLLEQNYGTIEVLQAVTEPEKHVFLQEAAKLHRARWADSEYGSGFDNPRFTDFHQCLLANDTNNETTAIYKLQAGDQVFGFIYLLIDDTGWKFYLSALDLQEDNRVKIGLLFHALIVEKAILSGVKSYDFLAGEARYKNSLSNETEYQHMVCIYRPSLLLNTLGKLRELKRRYFNQWLGA